MQLGIDFGTSLSSAALWRDGRLLLVKEPLRHGYSFPTSVYLAPSGDILVGQAAENQRLNDPGRYRREFKRELGGAIPLTLGDRAFLPEDLVAAVLRKLKREAENLTGGAGSLHGAVITVPADYQAHKRGLMERAARDAGFATVTLLEEPVAAALTYTRQAGEVAEGAAILVYDLGGGTFDVALLRRTGSSYVPIAVPLGLERCGGIDFDRVISRDLLARFPAVAEQVSARRQDRDAQRLRAGLVDFCREIKHLLSETAEAELPLPLGFPAESYALSRATFTTLIAPYLAETLTLCRQIVQSAGMQLADVAGILMVGGSCRMPPIQEAVATLGRPVWRVEEPELAVCQGAALHAILRDPAATGPLPLREVPPRPPVAIPAAPASPATATVQTLLAPIDVKDYPPVVPAPAEELIVSSEGAGQYRTIGEALRRAGAGATIRVQQGRYVESLIIERPVTLVGADPTFAIVLEGPTAPCVTLRAEGATLRGFMFFCTEGARASAPLVAATAGRATLENCHLIPGSHDGFAVRGAGSALTLQHCLIADGQQRGGVIAGGAQATLEDCQITRHAAANVYIADAGTRATLRRCQIAGGQQEGVRAVAGAEATLEECVVHDNAGAGVRAEGSATIALRACVLQGNRFGFAALGGTIAREGTTSLLNTEGDREAGAGTPPPPQRPPARQGDAAPPAVAPAPAPVAPIQAEEAPNVVAAPRVGLRPPSLVATLANKHLELVSTLAFSPDGRWLVSGDQRGQLWLWDVARRQMIRSFAPPSGRERTQAGGVCAVLFDPSGATLISSHHDTAVRLWDAQNGRLLHQLPGHSATVRAVALSPDGTFLASGGDDRTLLVWWLPTRQPLGALQGHAEAVTSVAIGPGEPLLASGSKDRTVRLWDLRSGVLQHTLAGHEDSVRAVRFDAAGSTLASCSNDRTVRLWDAQTGQPLRTLSGHDDAVYALAFARDGLLVSGGWDQRLILWDTATGRIERDWSSGADQWVATVAVSPVAPLLASAGYGGQIKLWEL